MVADRGSIGNPGKFNKKTGGPSPAVEYEVVLGVVDDFLGRKLAVKKRDVSWLGHSADACRFSPATHPRQETVRIVETVVTRRVDEQTKRGGRSLSQSTCDALPLGPTSVVPVAGS